MMDHDAEQEEIRRLTIDWVASEVRRDMEACLSYLAPDAVVQLEGTPTINSIAAMRDYWQQLFKTPYTDIVLEPRTVVVASSGDFAYDYGTWTVVFDSEDGRIEEPGKSNIVWRKLNGQWKSVFMSLCMDAPSVVSID